MIPPLFFPSDLGWGHWIAAAAIIAVVALGIVLFAPAQPTAEELMARASAARDEQVQWCLSRNGTAQTDAYNRYKGCAIPPGKP